MKTRPLFALFSLFLFTHALSSTESFAHESDSTSIASRRAHRKFIRCLNRVDDETKRSALSILIATKSLSQANSVCRGGSIPKILITARQLDQASALVEAHNPHIATSCKGGSLVAGGGVLVAAASGHIETLVCRTAAFKTVLLVGAGAGIGAGIGGSVAWMSMSEENVTRVRMAGPVYASAFQQNNGGLVFVTSADDFDITDFAAEEMFDVETFGEYAELIRGVGVGVYATWGGNIGAKLYSSITRKNIEDFQAAIGFVPQR